MVSKFRDDYIDIVTRIAELLVTRAERYDLPVLPEVPVLSDVPNAFERPLGFASRFTGIPRVEICFAVPSRDEVAQVKKRLENYGQESADWRPFYPSFKAEINTIVQSIMTEEKLYYAEISMDTLLQYSKEAELVNTMIVIIIDPWAVQLNHYRELMRALARSSLPSLSLLCVWSNPDEETRAAHQRLKEGIEQLFYFGRAIVEIQSVDELRYELRKILKPVSKSYSS
jgi:FxsC-like protein